MKIKDLNNAKAPSVSIKKLAEKVCYVAGISGKTEESQRGTGKSGATAKITQGSALIPFGGIC